MHSAAQLLQCAVGHAKRCLGVCWNLHMPEELAVLLTPSADNLTIDGVVAGIDMVYFIYAEVGPHVDMLEAYVGSSDTGNIFIEPGKQVAEQHDVVARVHLR